MKVGILFNNGMGIIHNCLFTNINMHRKPKIVQTLLFYRTLKPLIHTGVE